jgi:hypothetical protein
MDSKGGRLMNLEIKNLRTLDIEINFPKKEVERDELIKQLLNIKIENLKVIPSPIYTLIKMINELPVIDIRSSNQHFQLSQDSFGISLSTGKLFPEFSADKEKFEFNNDFINIAQSNYNLLIGMLIGTLKESSMEISVDLVFDYDYKYDFNSIFKDKYLLNLKEIFKNDSVDIKGFNFDNIYKEKNINYKYRLYLDDNDNILKIRFRKIYKNNIMTIIFKNIIDEAIENINICLSIKGG